MIISLSGAPGSGKSTIAMMLADKLSWPRYYIGGLRREIAQKRHLTIAEYNKLGESDPSTDKEVDDYLKRLGKEQDDFLVESRTAWFFIPHSFKIYLDAEENEAAKRIFKQLQGENSRNEGSPPQSLESVISGIKERVESDDFRYKKYYNIDYRAKTNYDFYLDTSNLTPAEVFEAVYNRVKSELDNKKK